LQSRHPGASHRTHANPDPRCQPAAQWQWHAATTPEASTRAQTRAKTHAAAQSATCTDADAMAHATTDAL
ncbi:MAG: hypothetical protein ACYC3N_10650, partial [Halothiobacillus sp.]